MLDSSNSLKNRLAGRSLYLVGMMGSGKTSTGGPLAKSLGYHFVDLDELIEKVTKCSISEIFKLDGELGFRKIETQVLSHISHHHSLVVATGGGVVTQSENWGFLHQGIVIWLDVKRDQLIKRLRTDKTQRPLLKNNIKEVTLDSLSEKRRPLYSEADLQISIKEETPEKVAEKILNLLDNLIKNNLKN